MTGLHISPELDLPLDAVTETFAILAKRRAGKSNAAVVMAEEMYDNGLPWVAIDPKGDWWGIRAAGDGEAPGLPVVVFGGSHGDVPLEPTGGRYVADLVVDKRLTCVLDVSEMTKADQRRFLIDFADQLYRTNAEPLHVFCEEADEYIPQRVMGENAKLVGVFETLVKRGGFRGIGITLITQRSASLNKDVLTQIETLIPMRTPSPQDRKAILAWVDYHSSGAEAVAELPGLANGEAWVFSPQWLDTLTKIQFRRRRTFDSGATPKVGGKPRPPATLAEVDLGAIKDAMADTIEKAKADDPKHLRQTIVGLRKEIEGCQREIARLQDEKPEPERVEVPAVSDETREELLTVARGLNVVVNSLLLELGEIPSPTSAPTPARPVVERTPVAPRPAARREPVVHDGAISPARRRLLDALVDLESIGVTEAPKLQLAVFAGVSPKSSGFSNNLGGLRSAGLIEYPGPSLVTITEAGRAHAEPIGSATTVEELHERVRGLVSPSRWRVMEPLLAAYPHSLDRDDLATQAGVSAASSGFSNNLGALRSLGLIDYPGPRQVAATDLLFI